MKRIGTGLVGIGVVLLLIETFAETVLFETPLGALAGVPGGWTTFVIAGVAAYAYDRYGLSLPKQSGKSAGLQRQDVIAATNWSRENKHLLRQSLGVSLATAGALGWLVASVLDVDLGLPWLVVALVGVILVGLSWRLSKGIKADHTREVTVRLPDAIALHTFHVRLRQFVEDRGYTVRSETSPSEGGRPSTFDGVWLSHGSFTARRRPIVDSLTFLPEIDDDPYLSKVLTAITLGFVGILVGFTLTRVQPSPTATDPNTALYDGAHLLGWLFVVLGVGLVAYGYVRRTREWAELYCVEEGTVYGANVNLYGDDARDAFESHATPNVSAPDTACELVVTLGATCTSLYDEQRLERDLEALAEEVPSLARGHRHEFFEDGSLTVSAIEGPAEPTQQSDAGRRGSAAGRAAGEAPGGGSDFGAGSADRRGRGDEARTDRDRPRGAQDDFRADQNQPRHGRDGFSDEGSDPRGGRDGFRNDPGRRGGGHDARTDAGDDANAPGDGPDEPWGGEDDRRDGHSDDPFGRDDRSESDGPRRDE